MLNCYSSFGQTGSENTQRHTACPMTRSKQEIWQLMCMVLCVCFTLSHLWEQLDGSGEGRSARDQNGSLHSLHYWPDELGSLGVM